MDSLYEFPEDALQARLAAKPWMSDPKHFKRVKVSPSATIKMLTHGQQGVDKGAASSGKPLEVMGLLLGRPDVEDPTALLVSDALPLPAEGFETRVVVEDPAVSAYMINLLETLETTRKEHFCGWYHTHPFDLDGTSHCYLSATDVSTQLLWQVSEDPHGQPWVALVLDPLLSIAQQKPEMKAFRVYPPTYEPPAHETPNGQIVKSEAQCVQQWGSCWNRYYTLSVEYFMSDLARDTLSLLHNQLLWHQSLSAPTQSATDNDNDGDDPTQSHNAITQMHTATQELQALSVRDARSRRFLEKESENGSGKDQSHREDHACTVCALVAKKMLFCRETVREKAKARESEKEVQSTASVMDV